MKTDKYISVKKGLSGMSFANLGIFTGFGGCVVDSVYSLILLEILGSAAIVGIYSSAYNAFGLIIALFFGEFLRLFSKAKIFDASMLTIFICYIMMSFSIKPGTFVVLDFFTMIPLLFISTLLPLFMSDFAGKDGIAKISGRYYMWANAGALLSPMIAMVLADKFGMRSTFFVGAIIYGLGWYIFRHYKIIQEDRQIKKINPRRTIKSMWRETIKYFKRPELNRAYWVNFGYYAMKALRSLYVPIIIIESGFSKDVLGLVLTIGIIPYVVLSEPIGRIAKKYGHFATKAGLSFGFLSFSAAAFALFFADGITMLVLFVLWQISGTFQEALHNMVFFDATKKSEQGRFFGIFNTSMNLPRFIIPLVGAAFVTIFGTTKAVWIAAGSIGILTTIILLSEPKNCKLKAND